MVWIEKVFLEKYLRVLLLLLLLCVYIRCRVVGLQSVVCQDTFDEEHCTISKKGHTRHVPKKGVLYYCGTNDYATTNRRDWFSPVCGG